MSMNTVVLSGNLVADPVSRTAGETLFATARIAVRRNFKNSKGEYDSDFFNIAAFKFAAERLLEAKKGTPISVTGRLRQSQWEDADGKKRDGVDVTVEEVMIGLKYTKTDTVEVGSEEITANEW